MDFLSRGITSKIDAIGLGNIGVDYSFMAAILMIGSTNSLLIGTPARCLHGFILAGDAQNGDFGRVVEGGGVGWGC